MSARKQDRVLVVVVVFVEHSSGFRSGRVSCGRRWGRNRRGRHRLKFRQEGGVDVADADKKVI